MKTAWPTGYQRRLLLLASVGLLIIGLFWTRKLGTTFQAWRSAHEQRTASVSMASLEAERMRLRTALARTDAIIGTTAQADAGWRVVLDILARTASTTGVALAGVTDEHLMEKSGTLIRTLPLSLKGRTAGLLNTIAEVERDTSGTHLLSVEFHAKATSHQGPRQLTATLYIQTLSR